jgi:hypothetical protein
MMPVDAVKAGSGFGLGGFLGGLVGLFLWEASATETFSPCEGGTVVSRCSNGETLDLVFFTLPSAAWAAVLFGFIGIAIWFAVELSRGNA